MIASTLFLPSWTYKALHREKDVGANVSVFICKRLYGEKEREGKNSY